VVEALKQMRQGFPFKVRGIDSDNGSEFINYHLYRYCQQEKIQLTRGRPYKKNDNAHIEQKNWTHVRKLIGWGRYETAEALAAMNAL
jgi:transposase InsO family protein